MRLASIGLASTLFASALLCAQQAPVPPAAADAPAAVPAAAPAGEAPVVQAAAAPQPVVANSPKAQDAIARGQEKAAEHARKEQAKADAKAAKQAEKDKKEAEGEAKFLKLQDNEIVAVTFDEQGNPVKLPPCSKKDKVCQQKRKDLLKQKQIGLHVQNGTLTVDGWTGKARLNYDVTKFVYLYISVPGYGTLVASPERFPNAIEAKNALDGQTLTISTADEHTVQLASDVLLSGKQKRSIFYSVDRTYQQPGNYPTVGYGFVNRAPYVWPGALPLTSDQKRWQAKAPELPKGMEARAMTLQCQNVAPGQSPKPIKVNGVLVTPPACKTGVATEAPGAYSTKDRPTDGSGAASTGIAEDHTRL